MEKNAFENLFPGKNFIPWKSVPLLKKNTLEEAKPRNILREAKDDPTKIKKEFNFPVLDFNFLIKKNIDEEDTLFEGDRVGYIQNLKKINEQDEMKKQII